MRADDVAILAPFETSNAACQSRDLEYPYAENQLRENRLTLNATKKKYILFHREQKSVPQHEFSKSLRGKNVVKVDDARLLGVFINKRKKWKVNFNHVTDKLLNFYLCSTEPSITKIVLALNSVQFSDSSELFLLCIDVGKFSYQRNAITSFPWRYVLQNAIRNLYIGDRF